MESNRTYIKMMEEQFFNLLETEADELVNDINKSKRFLSFISDRHFSTTSRYLSFNFKKAEKKISNQLKTYADIIERLQKLEGMPLSEEAQHRVYNLAAKLVGPALKLGYCEKACDLLKIIKNPNINRMFSGANVSSAILKVIENYGKRTILEENPKFKERVDSVIVDVVAGEYGGDTKQMLTVEKMEKAYSDAEVVKGDMVFHMDGTHEWADEAKKKTK